MACCHSNPVLDLPIIIGSYPIQDDLTTQTPYPSVAPPYPMNGIISQHPSAPLLNQTDFSALPYPSAPSTAFQFPNEG